MAKVKLYEPFEPALAHPTKNLDDVVRRSGVSDKTEVATEVKIDGFRCLSHYSANPGIEMYSRRLNQLSAEAYPEITSGIEKLGLDSVILDGELVGVDPETGKLAPFSETMARKRKTFNSKGLPLKYLVFDAVMIDGKEFVDKPYSERREVLEDVKWNNTVELIDVKRARTPEEIEESYQQALIDGFEGLMVKKIDAPYGIGGKRRDWVKYKPTVDVDCVMMGWYLGNGCREEWSSSGEEGVGAFLFGIRNEQTGKYETLVKSGNGLNKDWAISLLDRAKELEIDEMPRSYVKPNDKDIIPDYWISPEIVIELRGQQFTRSENHSSGYSLRFGKLKREREDKNLKSVSTVSEIEGLCT